jgi:hypothetical protein
VTVSVDPTGTYEVAVPDLSWSFSGSIGFPLANIQVATGVDGLGAYQEIAFDFQSDAARHASIRGYTDHADVLFTVSNPAGTAANSFTFPNLSKFPQIWTIAFTGLHLGLLVYTEVRGSSSIPASTRSFSRRLNFMTAQTAWGLHGDGTPVSHRRSRAVVGFEHRTLLTFAKDQSPLTRGERGPRFTESRGRPTTPMPASSRSATGPTTARPTITRWPPR